MTILFSPHPTADERCSSAFLASRRTRAAMPESMPELERSVVSRAMSSGSTDNSSTLCFDMSDSNAMAVRSAADERFAQCRWTWPTGASVEIWHDDIPSSLNATQLSVVAWALATRLRTQG